MFDDLRIFRRWEAADIALIVFVYRGSNCIAKKVGLLQSKRLYPVSSEVDEDDPLNFAYGMNRFLSREPKQAIGALHSRFDFTYNCTYGALKSGAGQIQIIRKLNDDFGKICYYLFYNPPQVPFSVQYPLRSRMVIENIDLGCQVYDPSVVDGVLDNLPEGTSPSLHTLQSSSRQQNWPLEEWASDLLLTCRVGQQFDDSRDAEVRSFLQRRSGPIGAALAVSITLAD
ncbi:hypothetical protein [Salinarimonas sp.]|uniref:hypothetical protein n=1 Tax=Salinarimonas sp. TaxID=2766526 RepID=UPI0032D99D1E